jgi:hypothetical protein
MVKIGNRWHRVKCECGTINEYQWQDVHVAESPERHALTGAPVAVNHWIECAYCHEKLQLDKPDDMP